MEEEIISFETAKLAKEKGCTLEKFVVHYHNYYKDDGTEGCVMNGHIYLENPPYIPQSLLQKWLREKHNIDITIHRSFSMNKSYHYCIIVNCNYDNELQQECIKNRTYEEALEEGLKEALKLIK